MIIWFLSLVSGEKNEYLSGAGSELNTLLKKKDAARVAHTANYDASDLDKIKKKSNCESGKSVTNSQTRVTVVFPENLFFIMFRSHLFSNNMSYFNVGDVVNKQYQMQKCRKKCFKQVLKDFHCPLFVQGNPCYLL